MGANVTDQILRICPSCGQDLSAHPYYQTRPGPAARLLRKIAMALLPVMAAVYLFLLFQGDRDMGFGTGAGYLAVGLIGGPSFLLYAISRLLPRSRLVICLRCSWNQEYPPSGRLVTGQSAHQSLDWSASESSPPEMRKEDCEETEAGRTQ